MKRKPWQPDKEHSCIVGAQERAGAPGHCATTMHTQSKVRVSVSDPNCFSLGLNVCTPLGRQQLDLSRILFYRNEALLQHPVANIPRAIPAQSHASVLPLHFCPASNQGLCLRRWICTQPAPITKWLVLCRFSSLQLEASLRSYLTHLGQIVVSKEI